VTPRRIVSLCPSITETLVSIGGLRLLVGATRYCTRPKGMLWGLPRIGGTKDPDVGRIVLLKPDLVFANEEENRREDVEALRASGIEVDVSLPKRVSDVPGSIRAWGTRLGRQGEADALASRIDAEIAGFAKESAPRPFPYAYWIWKDPWMTISDDTYVADLLRLAGGVNVFGGESERYPSARPGESIARGAKVHFFPSEPFPFRARRHDTETAEIFGSASRRLFVEGDDYCWHGARTLDGLAAMRRLRADLAEKLG
jgi:ABC-type Fe3+-hydroxamate transport system substrate-binding protein